MIYGENDSDDCLLRLLEAPRYGGRNEDGPIQIRCKNAAIFRAFSPTGRTISVFSMLNVAPKIYSIMKIDD